MPISRCLKCAGDIIPSGMGRPPKWCGALCRQRANRTLRRLRRDLAEAEAGGLQQRAAYLSAWVARLEGRDPSWPPPR